MEDRQSESAMNKERIPIGTKLEKSAYPYIPNNFEPIRHLWNFDTGCWIPSQNGCCKNWSLPDMSGYGWL